MGIWQNRRKERAVATSGAAWKKGRREERALCICCYSLCQHSPQGDSHFKLLIFKVCAQPIFCSSKKTQPFALQTQKSTLAGREINAGQGERGVLQMEQITQAKGLLQFSSRGMILSPGGSQGICCSCVGVDTNWLCWLLLTLTVPLHDVCLSCLSPAVPITGSVQDIDETMNT